MAALRVSELFRLLAGSWGRHLHSTPGALINVRKDLQVAWTGMTGESRAAHHHHILPQPPHIYLSSLFLWPTLDWDSPSSYLPLMFPPLSFMLLHYNITPNRSTLDSSDIVGNLDSNSLWPEDSHILPGCICLESERRLDLLFNTILYLFKTTIHWIQSDKLMYLSTVT